MHNFCRRRYDMFQQHNFRLKAIKTTMPMRPDEQSRTGWNEYEVVLLMCRVDMLAVAVKCRWNGEE